jgi:hypothetical protein
MQLIASFSGCSTFGVSDPVVAPAEFRNLVFSTTVLALYNKYQEYEVNAEQIVLRLVAKVDMLEEENKVLKQKLNERQPQLPIEDAPNYNLKTVFQYPWDAPRKRRMSGSKLLRLDTNTEAEKALKRNSPEEWNRFVNTLRKPKRFKQEKRIAKTPRKELPDDNNRSSNPYEK